MSMADEINKILGPKKLLSMEEWATSIKAKVAKPQLIKEILPLEAGEYIIIAGRTGIGKTNLALHLAFCLASGNAFLGFPCQTASVAYIAFEGDADNLAERYHKLCQVLPAPDNRLGFELMALDSPHKMFEHIENISKGFQVLILDPIKYLILGDFCKPRDAERFIRHFREMLTANQQVGIATLPIRKPGNQELLIYPGDIYSIKGATEYADSATSALLLEKKFRARKETEITLHFAKHRVASKALESLELEFNYDSCIHQIH